MPGLQKKKKRKKRKRKMRSIILKSGLDEILFNAICKVTNLVV